LNIRINRNKRIRIFEIHREFFQAVETYRKTDRQICTMSRIVDIKAQCNSLLNHFAFQFIHSFMDYTAVCQQQETGHGTQLTICMMGTVSLSWGHIGWRVAFTFHQPLASKLKKEESETSNPPLG